MWVLIKRCGTLLSLAGLQLKVLVDPRNPKDIQFAEGGDDQPVR
jgi:hypothetical protein